MIAETSGDIHKLLMETEFRPCALTLNPSAGPGAAGWTLAGCALQFNTRKWLRVTQPSNNYGYFFGGDADTRRTELSF